MIKIKTVHQFKVFEYINNNFNIDMIRLQLIDDDSILIIDSNNESMLFNYFDLLSKNLL